MIKEIIMLVMDIIPKGSYEKIDRGYSFETEEGNCLITVAEDLIEFYIKTIKWLPGSYEPIEEKALYSKIEYEELEGLNDEEIKHKFSSILNKINR